MKRISIIALTLVMAMVLGTFAVSAAPIKEFSLIPAADAVWEKVVHNDCSVNAEHKEDGTVVFSGSVSGTWPSATHRYAEPIVANVETDSLVIDFNVANGNTNINLNFTDGAGTEYTYSLCKSMFADRNYDTGSGDLMADDYVITISLKDFVETTALYQGTAFPAGAIVDGTLQFAGIQVYSVNGAVVTVKKLAVSCEVDRPAIEYAEGLETALTATDGKSGYADGDVIYYPAGDEDRVLTSADNNFRYTYLMIVDENGKIIEVGNNLVANNADFQGEITVPAGGFAISFFYNASSATANQALYDVYASLTGEKVDPAVFTIYNETIAVDGGDYVVSCDGENLKVTVGAEEEPELPPTGDASMIVFVMLALVSLAGVSLAVKAHKEF